MRGGGRGVMDNTRGADWCRGGGGWQGSAGGGPGVMENTPGEARTGVGAGADGRDPREEGRV